MHWNSIHILLQHFHLIVRQNIRNIPMVFTEQRDNEWAHRGDISWGITAQLKHALL